VETPICAHGNEGNLTLKVLECRHEMENTRERSSSSTENAGKIKGSHRIMRLKQKPTSNFED